MKKIFGSEKKAGNDSEKYTERGKTISKLQKQEKIMTIAILSLIIITTISVMLIIFVLLIKN